MKYLTTLAMAAALGLAAATPAPAFEFDQKALAYKQHILQCFGLLLTDPAKRAAECGTGPESTGFSLDVTNNGGQPFECAPPTQWNGSFCEWPEG